MTGASLGANRVLRSQLVGVSPFDVATIGGMLTVLIAVALLARGQVASCAMALAEALGHRRTSRAAA